MTGDPTLLVVNVGSTSVKLAAWRGGHALAHTTAPLAPGDDAARLAHVVQAAREFLAAAGVHPQELGAVVARGGILRPLPGGTYRVDEAMLADLRAARYGRHASNLSGQAAHALAAERGLPAFVVDPPTVDELDDVARLTGLPEIRRRSIFHALSQKAAARRACRELGRDYAASRLIVVHLGGGISVGAHRDGRVADVNDALGGDGPIAPERAGTLPAAAVADLCFAGRWTREQFGRRIAGEGGLFAHLQTREMREARRRIEAGDAQAAAVVEAIAYTVSKAVGAMAAVLEGRVDALVFTGALAAWDDFVVQVRARVGFLAPVFVYHENLEMAALAEGALRVLRGEEAPRAYAP